MATPFKGKSAEDCRERIAAARQFIRDLELYKTWVFNEGSIASSTLFRVVHAVRVPLKRRFSIHKVEAGWLVLRTK